MDPTKTISYRRWRNQIANKRLFGADPTANGSFEPSQRQLGPTREAKVEQGQLGLKLKKYCAQQRGDELEMQRLVKELEKEYRKNDFFRKEKVAEFKRLIKLELYHVSGKALVEKWFPQFPESEYR
jgi:hypothetical protein